VRERRGVVVLRTRRSDADGEHEEDEHGGKALDG
jgi:hypothetical protein